MIYKDPNEEIEYGPLLRRMIRSRPSGYFVFQELSRSDVVAVEFFLQRLERESFDLENIRSVAYDATLDLTTVYTDFTSEVWKENHFHGYKILHDARGRAAQTEPTYSIQGGVLFSSNGIGRWNGVVDLTHYRFFCWEDNTLRMMGQNGTSDVIGSINPLSDEFKRKMLNDIFDALKELKPCVKK